jgi:hypothetical protein
MIQRPGQNACYMVLRHCELQITSDCLCVYQNPRCLMGFEIGSAMRSMSSDAYMPLRGMYAGPAWIIEVPGVHTVHAKTAR